MADGFDVAARLAEGRPAVERTQTYVDACHQLRYQQPDLTAHASQVRDWYDTEAGLDLRVLDDDTGALRAAVTAIEEALWVQRTQITELAVAWRGRGADSARRFLQQHWDIATEVAKHVRAAAEHYGALREDIWKAVDGKVATTVAIDERRMAQRSAWLAAAHFVTAGTGDRSMAEEVIRQQITPYVDNDIRNDWLAAMGSSAASVAASYDAAIHALASTSEVRFDIPGDLGPSWQPVLEQHPVAESTPVMSLPPAPVPTVPAAAAPAPQPPISQEPAPLSATGLDDAASMPPELATPLGDVGGLSSGAGNLGGVTGGIGGVVGSIIDSIGSILGSLAGGFGDGAGAGDLPTDDPLELADDDKPEDADDDKPDDADDDEPDDADDDKPEPVGVDADVTPEQPADPLAETPSATGDSVGEPVGQASDPPPPAAPVDQPGPANDGPTPCEIAEDQLPQAGQ